MLIRSSSRIILPLHHRKRGKGRRLTLNYGRAGIVYPDGTVEWADSEPQPNFTAEEGKASLLNVYFRGLANPSKYLVLLTAEPDEQTTMATMGELFTPGLFGYDREQYLTSEWGAPVLLLDDYTSTADQKVVGPASGDDWEDIVAVGLVSAGTGTGGIFISGILLEAPVTVLEGNGFFYQMLQRAST